MQQRTSALPHHDLLGFQEVPVSDDDTVVVPDGYVARALIPWGTPLFAGAAAFQEDASNSAADQATGRLQPHGLHYFPLGHGRGRGSRRGLLVLNHEYTDASQIYSAAIASTITPDAAGLAKVAKALAGHE